MSRPAHRIVSLLPSATEIVCGLGLEGQLVGRSHECDHPPSVRRLPVCTAPKFSPHGTSDEIDRAVRAILRDALSVYRVDVEQLARLHPSHIVTQTQCEVCAVSLRDVEEAVAGWTASRPRIVSLGADRLSGVWADIQRVADALDVPGRGRRLIAGLEDRMARIARRAEAITSRPRVAGIEWIEPLISAGNWMPELTAMAGGVPLFGEAGKHSPRLAWEDLRTADPDVLLIFPCGFEIARTRKELPALTGRPGWSGLQAVRGRRTCLLDGNAYFNRSGPRLAESLEILAEVLHPNVFSFGHEGRGLERI